jgi:hypothetical protein
VLSDFEILSSKTTHLFTMASMSSITLILGLTICLCQDAPMWICKFTHYLDYWLAMHGEQNFFPPNFVIKKNWRLSPKF